MKTAFFKLMLATALLVAGPFFPVMASDAFQRTADATDTAWKEKNIEMINTVRALILSWADNWRERNIDHYMAYYSPSFRSGDLDYRGWQERKTRLFKTSGAIFLEVRDLGVVIEGDHASASFFQHYRDAHHTDIGEKIINLIQNNGSWQIISEEWRPLGR